MSVGGDLTPARHHVDDLCRLVRRDARRIGDGPGVRRVGAGTGQPRESIALWHEPTAAATPMATRGPGPVVTPDDPYGSSLWTNCDNSETRDNGDNTGGLDDEGLGAQGRPAP